MCSLMALSPHSFLTEPVFSEPSSPGRVWRGWEHNAPSLGTCTRPAGRTLDLGWVLALSLPLHSNSTLALP